MIAMTSAGMTSVGALHAAPNPWLSWDYVVRNRGDLTRALEQHTSLTIQAVLIAFVIALPLAALAHTRPRLAAPLVGLAGVLYTVPSVALFAVLAPFTGIGRTTVLIGLVTYALLVLVRNIVVGLDGVAEEVRDAARGLGYGPARLLLRVELPNALPAIVAGVRLATVSTVALATVGVVVGYGGLGQLMFRGFRSRYHAEILTATLLCLALALACDLVLYVAGRLITPWSRSTRTT